MEVVGPGVGGFAPGDHVLLTWLPYCGHCRQCVRGWPNRCENTAWYDATLEDGMCRFHRDGQPVHHYNTSSFAERSVVPARTAVKVDASLPLTELALMGCAVITGVGAVLNTAHVARGLGRCRRLRRRGLERRPGRTHRGRDDDRCGRRRLGEARARSRARRHRGRGRQRCGSGCRRPRARAWWGGPRLRSARPPGHDRDDARTDRPGRAGGADRDGPARRPNPPRRADNDPRGALRARVVVRPASRSATFRCSSSSIAAASCGSIRSSRLARSTTSTTPFAGWKPARRLEASSSTTRRRRARPRRGFEAGAVRRSGQRRDPLREPR